MGADVEDIADGEATPADPGAIDLEAIRKRYCAQFYAGKLDPASQAMANLITAVEALRARVTELTGALEGFRCALLAANNRAEAAEAREADMKADYLRRHKDACDRFEELIAVKAREAALTGALEAVPQSVLSTHGRGGAEVCPNCGERHEYTSEIIHKPGCYILKIQVVLAATPAQALERAKAVEKIVGIAREMVAKDHGLDCYEAGLTEALVKLDALGKKEG